MSASMSKYVLLATTFCFLSAPAFADDTKTSPAPGTAASAPTSAAPAEGPNSLMKALTDTTPFLEERFRYESVHQDGLKYDAHAENLRTILGFDTGTWQHIKITAAMLNLAQFGNHDYNDGADGKTAFPKIGDPGNTQLLLANVNYTGIPDSTVIVGRQYIELDNARFIGAANWRQNRQVFDAATGINKSIKDLELFYSFIFHEERSPGPNVTDGTYDMHTHAIHLAYTGIPDVRLVAYDYLEDIRKTATPAATPSTATYGGRAEAKHAVYEDFSATGAVEYARQTDYANNTKDYGLNYYMVQPGMSWKNFWGKYTYEAMEGDGSNSFQTPLASLHTMNGWADQFQTTPVQGLKDQFLSLGMNQKFIPGLDATKIEGQWHTYHALNTSARYGDEIDVDMVQPFLEHYRVGVQYEDYNADSFGKDVQKIILTGQINF